jgi:hypothetical protein
VIFLVEQARRDRGQTSTLTVFPSRAADSLVNSMNPYPLKLSAFTIAAAHGFSYRDMNGISSSRKLVTVIGHATNESVACSNAGGTTRRLAALEYHRTLTVVHV